MRTINVAFRDESTLEARVLSWDFSDSLLSLEYDAYWMHYPLDTISEVMVNKS